MFRTAIAAALLLFLDSAGISQAETFPNRRLTIIIPFAAGGTLDVVARIVGDGLSKRLGQPVIVDNRPGAAGMIGARQVANAEPDGYTLMFAVSTVMAVAPATLKHVPLEPVKAFTAVVEISRGPFIFMVSPALPIKNLDEFIAYTKAHPGSINFGSVGIGSTHQFIGALLNKNAGIEMSHVPFKGGGEVYSAVIGGQVQAMVDTMPSPLGYIQGGSVRALAVTGSKRLDKLPDVPTFAERGLPALDIQYSYGLVAPARTPKDIIDKLNVEITQVLETPGIKSLLEKQEVYPTPETPEKYGEFLTALAAHWKTIVAETGFQLLE